MIWGALGNLPALFFVRRSRINPKLSACAQLFGLSIILDALQVIRNNSKIYQICFANRPWAFRSWTQILFAVLSI